jgi:hypothetical protein
LITEAALAFLAGLAAAAFLVAGRRRGFLGFLADHFIEAHAVFGGELLHALQQIFWRCRSGGEFRFRLSSGGGAIPQRKVKTDPWCVSLICCSGGWSRVINKLVGRDFIYALILPPMPGGLASVCKCFIAIHRSPR